jgi:hypothetical protein
MLGFIYRGIIVRRVSVPNRRGEIPWRQLAVGLEIWLIGICCAAGCTHDANITSSRSYSSRGLQLGQNTRDVIKLFGLPKSIDRPNGDVQYWTYDLSTNNDDESTSFFGLFRSDNHYVESGVIVVPIDKDGNITAKFTGDGSSPLVTSQQSGLSGQISRGAGFSLAVSASIGVNDQSPPNWIVDRLHVPEDPRRTYVVAPLQSPQPCPQSELPPAATECPKGSHAPVGQPGAQSPNLTPAADSLPCPAWRSKRVAATQQSISDRKASDPQR